MSSPSIRCKEYCEACSNCFQPLNSRTLTDAITAARLGRTSRSLFISVGDSPRMLFLHQLLRFRWTVAQHRVLFSSRAPTSPEDC
uniref:Uncharacterized protein n=1 Tax=Steinernema glaseri TaxID=37863 RepID=A0A1I7XYB3_9BILA